MYKCITAKLDVRTRGLDDTLCEQTELNKDDNCNEYFNIRVSDDGIMYVSYYNKQGNKIINRLSKTIELSKLIEGLENINNGGNVNEI